ncbi:hypothetical protein B0H17DRAFT_276428 [Mycena rosella]|uniref:RNase III domain-containing protein n=1 Tax=Mycena rosella TaxID=1033263 RepID=A0AAD7GP00_MYCRO|nr:hypothetical protein B0H17DRAFT_276428 [Mycena rosella]
MSSSLSSSPSLSSSSRRRAQRTLVEQAHLLPDDLLSEDRFLRHPIPSRIRVAPNSEPQILMQQLDNVDGWKPLKVAYPTFPEDYPPKPLLLDFDTLRTVFTTGENAAFEWLGDAMIGAAQALCIHRSTVTSDSKPLRSETITGTLVTEPFLAHLALLYGLQLHDYCARTGTGSIPSMERTCDVFESYVGAAALHCGVVDTLAWLEILFSPWVLKFCATDEMLPPTMLSRAVRLKLDAWTRKAPGAAVVELEPLRIETREFAAGAGNLVALPLASSEDARALLGNALPTWPHVDLSTVQLPDNYPPPPPALSTAHLQQLTDAMTDVFCQIYFGAHVGSNQRYSIVGKRIYWLAVTKLSMEKLPTATPAELDVRVVNHRNSSISPRNRKYEWNARATR